MNSRAKHSFILATLLTLTLVSTQAASSYFQPAQTQEDESKGLIPKPFLARRPVAQKKRAPKSRAERAKKVVYRRISKPLKNNFAEKTETASIGFTIWKRKAVSTDNTKGISENRTGAAQIPDSNYERVNSETPLAVGENIQITVESLTHRGYLYIIDREKYSDGTYSEPKIIYPIRGRDNAVDPGVLKSTGVFDIVAPQAEKKQVEEVFTVIISPAPLVPAEQLRGGFLSLDPERFKEWQDKWNVDAEIIEQEEGAGQVMTEEETKGIQENRKLTQDDPPPLTIYRAFINRGSAIMINFHLKFDSAAR